MEAVELVQPYPKGSADTRKVTPLSPNGSPSYVGDIEEYPLVKGSPAYKLAKPVTLTFKNLSYSVQTTTKEESGKSQVTRREILRGMTGICKPGELTAIMGASGAGKTTLLNILSVRTVDTGKNKLGGEFLANGQPYNVGKFSKFAGYVMQNDILLETMTPREIFQFTADLRLSDGAQERKRKVNKLIQDLKLERAADTLVGGTFYKGISGGERKRTSIGVELITDPNLLFLDEPTSGLDSFTAFMLINLLKTLAVNSGKTIIFTIHQPSSDIFFMFDNLMILAKGKFIYQGPALSAVNYFGSIGYQCPEYSNPADYFIEIAHSDGNDDKKFQAMYQVYDNTKAIEIDKEVAQTNKTEVSLAEKATGFMRACGLISQRSFLNFFRNPIHLRGRIGQTAFMTFLCCCIFFQLNKDPNNPKALFDINGALFFFGLMAFMSSAMSVVLTFPSERAVFLREYSANMYSVSAYYFGRSFVEIPFVIVFPMIMTAISYYIIQFNSFSVGKFFMFMLILVFMSLTGNAVGLLVGSCFSDPKVAANVTPAVVLPWMLFSGFFINVGSMPVWLRWIQYISPFRYSLESFMWNEYTHSPFGEAPLAEYNYSLGMWGAFGILVGIGLAWRAASLFALKTLVRKLE